MQSLHDMQHGKCCYCEISISDWGSGKHVEHYKPRESFQALRFEWSNLLLACADCNGAKWHHFPTTDSGQPFLIDPSDPDVDPEDHISFVVDGGQHSEPPFGMAISRSGSILGRETIRVVKLYGEQHTRRRRQVLDKLRSLLVQLLSELARVVGGGDAGRVADLRGQLQRATHAGEQYAGLARAFYHAHNLASRGVPIA